MGRLYTPRSMSCSRWLRRWFWLGVLLLPSAVLAQPSVQSQLDRGLELLQLGDSQGALTVLKQAEQTAPSSAAVQRVLGLVYQRQENYAQAIAALRQAVELDAKNLQGQLSLGWTLHLDGQDAEAAQSLWQAIELNPKSVEAYNALAIVRLAQDNVEAALAINRWALRLKPDNEIAFYNLALACHRAWDWPCALDSAQRAAQLEPSNPHPPLAAAIAYQDRDFGSQGKRGLSPEAKRLARQATELDSRFFDASFRDNNLRRAGFSVEQRQTAALILGAS